MQEKQTQGFNILICGSQQFHERGIVYGMLDAWNEETGGMIGSIMTSRFSGACEYAREWIDLKKEQGQNIEHKSFVLDMHLEQKNSTLYEEMSIPSFVLQNDPFFVKGKELLLENKINLVFAFPNAEGKLGAATSNICRFAQLAQINYFDCSDALRAVIEERAKQEDKEEVKADVKEAETGFKNKRKVF